jgi:sortase A
MKTTAEVIGKIKRIVNRTLGRSDHEPRSSEATWRLWESIETGLLLSGLSLLFMYAAIRLDGYLSSRAALKSFQSADHSAIVNALPPMEDRTSMEQDTADEDEQEPHTAAVKPSPQRCAPLGVLDIPNIHLLVPVLDGTDALTLNRGAGRIVGTARPGKGGNIGIAGHRDSFFRPLKDIKAGDSIVLETEGGVDTYVVDRLQIVSPRDVGVLRSEATPSLTLVTCYPFYFVGKAPKRFVVTAYLTKHAAAGSTTSSPRLSTQPTNHSLTNQTMEEQ